MSWNWTRQKAARRFFSTCRLLHVYVSTALFSLLVFFSLTGLTLNHAQFFTGDASEDVAQFSLPEELSDGLRNQRPAPVDELQTYVELITGLNDLRSMDVDLEAGEIGFDYPLPAGFAFVSVDIEAGEMLLESGKGTWVALLNDLHKGRHSGAIWSWIIDLSAVLITVFSFTGLMILLQQQKRRSMGLVLTVFGTLTPFLVYLLWVPRL